MTHRFLHRVRAVLLCLATLAPAAISRAEPVSLRAFDADSMTEIRRAHPAQPFLLAFWSLYCDPCREDMAQWAALRRGYPKLPIILVATDPPQEHARVLQFLRQHDLRGIEVRAFSDEYAERIRYAVDRSWRGELPRNYLFDASHRAQARSGPLPPDWLERLLGAPRRDR